MDRKIAIFLIPFFLLITGPYVLAWTLPSQGLVFGGFLLNPIDGNSYLAKMLEGWRGEWAFTLPYTAQVGSGAPIFLFYLLLGHFSRITGLSMILVFHITRIMGAFFLFWELAQLSSVLFPNSKKLQREGMALAVFGSGLGWLVILLGGILSDVWVAEGYPFLSSLSNPHFTIGMALLIRIFLLFLAPGSLSKYVQLMLFGVLIALIMPFGQVVACTVTGIGTLVEWRKTKTFDWRSLFSLAIPGGLYLCYQYWAVLQDPLLSQWNAQNQTPSPPVWDLLLSTAPAIVLAAWGAWIWLKDPQSSPAQRFVLGWLLGGLIMVYLPFSLQRRFIFALFVPISFIAMRGVQFLREKWPGLARKMLPILWISSLLTNAVVLIIIVFGVISHQPIFFVTQDEAEAFGFVQSALPPDALILCSPETGLFIPAWTGRRVLYGHEFETVDAAHQKTLAEQMLAGKLTQSQQSDLMRQKSIQYVFSGPREKKLGGPDFLSFMKPVFQNASITIYAWQN